MHRRGSSSWRFEHDAGRGQFLNLALFVRDAADLPVPSSADIPPRLAGEIPDCSAVLSPDEGAKVARLAEVWAMARDVWGDDAAARAFLFRPHPMLEGERPVDVVLATEFGRPLVEGILGRLQYGSAA